MIYRVSGGNPPKAHEWRSDDVSGVPERIPIIKNSHRTDRKFSSKTAAPSG